MFSPQPNIKTPAPLGPSRRQKAFSQSDRIVRPTEPFGRILPSRAEKKKPMRTPAYIEYKNVHPAVEVALYYGFTPLASPLVITKKDKDKAREFEDQDKTEPFSIAPTLEEKITMLRYYEEKSLQESPQPVMFSAEFHSGSQSKRKPNERRLSFEIMGGDKSIAEATLIQTAFATLQEEKHTNLMLSINSVGDRESMSQFVRELVNYYRKHIASLPQSCKLLLRKNPLELLKCHHEKCHALAAEAPKSIGFLGDGSRRHFKEVLEFLEELDIPYRIDHSLNGNRVFATETLFEIWETTPEARQNDSVGQGTSLCLGSGVRYNALGKRLGLRHDAPSIGLNLLLSRPEEETPAPRFVRFKRPSVFFLHLGLCAKLKSLHVIEVLRKAHIPLYQALSRDKLTSQLSSAEHLKIPYSIILGQREALENSVIIRNTSTRAQETVKLHNLVEHLQKMKLG